MTTLINRKSVAWLVGGVAALVMSGCGGHGDDQEVTGVRFLANDINVGESVRVESTFTSGSSDLIDVDSTTLVYEISRSLQLQQTSFRLFEGSNDREDTIVPSDIVNCDDGRTLVRIFLSRSDLRGNDFNGEFKLKFNVVGAEATNVAVIGGAAGRGRDVSCNEDFDSQASDAVRVN